MLLMRTESLPEGPAWSVELKLDGYRALVIKTGGMVQLRSRNNKDFSSRYPAVMKALAAMPDETVITKRMTGYCLLHGPGTGLHRTRGRTCSAGCRTCR